MFRHKFTQKYTKKTNIQRLKPKQPEKFRAAVKNMSELLMSDYFTDTTNSFTGVKLYLLTPLFAVSVQAAKRKK